MAIVYLAGNKLTGESTDSKPTTVATGSIFVENNTNKTYQFNGSSWDRLDEGVGDSVSESEITGTISDSKLATGISGGKITAGSVTSTQLSSTAVVDGVIGDGTISGAKLTTGSITATQLSDDSVGAAEIQDNAVTATQVLDTSITLSKLANGTAGKLVGYNASTGVIEEQDIPSSSEFGIITVAGTTTPTKQTGVTEVVVDATNMTSGIIDVDIDGTTNTTIVAGGTFNKLVNPSTSISIEAIDGTMDLTNITDQELTLVDATDMSGYEAQPRDCCLVNGGTEMYVAGDSGNGIDQWTLSTANDMSTATHTGFYSTTGQSGSVFGVYVGDNGTKMYMCAQATTTVYQYTLSTPYAVTSASYVTSTSSLISQGGGNCTGMTWSTNGEHFYLQEQNSGGIHQYDCSTPWDLSTYSYSSKAYMPASGNTPGGVSISPDGKQIIHTMDSTNKLYHATLTTAYDISTAVDSGGDWTVGSGSPKGCTWGSDGTKVFVVENGNDDMYEYTCAAYSPKGSSSPKLAEEVTPAGMWVGDSGTKLYTIGNNSVINQYTLGTAYDASTATYASKNLSITSQISMYYAKDVQLSDDGTKAYVISNSSDDVYQYTLSTPWDISTGSYASKKMEASVESQSPQAFHIYDSGSKVVIAAGANNGILHQYTLSTPWDVSTGSYSSKSYSLAASGLGNNWYGVFVSDDGLKMLCMDNASNVTIHNLATANDISTAVYDSDVGEVRLRDFCFGNGFESLLVTNSGTKLWSIANTSDSVYTFDVTGTLGGTTLYKVV